MVVNFDKNKKEFEQERKGFRFMIASSQFSNLQLQICNLATWQFGNLVIWQLDNLARNAELTFNFGNFLNLELSILATFNFGYFQFNVKTVIYGKKYINHFQLVTFKLC